MKPLDVLIVGAGFAGLYMLHRMKLAGRSAQIVDESGGVGGVWYKNRYPGARCDVESLQYSYSFDDDLQQEWRWTERYASRAEILSYMEHVVERFGLRDGIRLNAGVEAAEFDSKAKRWLVRTTTGERFSAKFLVLATGSLTMPNLPDIAGLDSFAGKILHTAQWPEQPIDFTGKKVAVIGTGSTGIQMISEVAKSAAGLTVFQRTANYALPMRNQLLTPEMDREWKANYPERRSRARALPTGVFGDFNNVSALSVTDDERRQEYERRWTLGGFQIMMAYNDFLTNQKANDTIAEFVRSKITARVRDPETARKLLPNEFPIGTKRVCLEDSYYDAFNRPNVQLVALKEEPIVEIFPNGIRTSQKFVEVDTLIFATGFDAITGSVAKVDIRGALSENLSQLWKSGPRSLFGLGVSGFPNLFLVSGPGSPIGRSNAVTSIEQNVGFIADIISFAGDHGHSTVEPSSEAQDRWVEKLAELADSTLYMKAKSWWNGANIEGKARAFMIYAGGVPSYLAACNEEKDSGFPNYIFS